jgi:hypothetical protein
MAGLGRPSKFPGRPSIDPASAAKYLMGVQLNKEHEQ